MPHSISVVGQEIWARRQREQHLQLKAKLTHERMFWGDLFEHRQTGQVVLELFLAS